eukprot:2386759-Pyramimonas_sp.AAC.1
MARWRVFRWAQPTGTLADDVVDVIHRVLADLVLQQGSQRQAQVPPLARLTWQTNSEDLEAHCVIPIDRGAVLP